MARVKKVTKIAKDTFDTGDSITKFGEKVTDHHLLAKGAEAQQLEVQSQTHLEDDKGEGKAAIVRCFTFGMNVASFREVQPTKQQLFNHHLKGIEIALWKDGLQILTDVTPRIVFNEKKLTYQIFVGAVPMRGHILREQPKTLKELVHGV